ncbi:MAG TPA: LamG domain-containing protein [Flavisolibacter sp.]|nr:LamG domain-containing protein [Flavisolibacter sp.]
MYNKNITAAGAFAALLAFGSFSIGCTKPDKSDDFAKGDPPPVAGGFVNSSDVAPGSLVAHFPFEGSVNDAKGAVTGGTTNGTTSFIQGRKGQAYKGSANGFISYTTPGPIATLQSFTISMWINTQKHGGGAQGVFMLAKQDGSFWGNLFMMIEGHDLAAPVQTNRMFMKLHFEKNNAPFIEHWLEPHGFGTTDFRPDDMYGGWRHVAWTYDAATSKAGFYINGEKRGMPAGMEDRKADGTGAPLGALNFKNPTRFVIGAFQNQLGAPFNAPESWMLPYTGALDEFRVYNKALSAQEINAIAVLERQGR